MIEFVDLYRKSVACSEGRASWSDYVRMLDRYVAQDEPKEKHDDYAVDLPGEASTAA